MKRKEFIQVKGLDLKELTVKVKALKGEIADLVLDKNMKKLKDLKMVSKKKKELAQILTVIRQKELLMQLESRVQKEDVNKSVIPSQAPEGEGESATLSGKIATPRRGGARNDKSKRSKKV